MDGMLRPLDSLPLKNGALAANMGPHVVPRNLSQKAFIEQSAPLSHIWQLINMTGSDAAGESAAPGTRAMCKSYLQGKRMEARDSGVDFSRIQCIYNYIKCTHSH
ncbi:hypothetical protein CIRG_08840 [Coccidioides immitis RMSCC 2394]|uniref:Uncharacterized protein n=1 Tax=Coccidioides immitis RMSCC 2394 TaxID=404692 RepID=A0A0J6YPM7_COCIT|nr:hypothetical protein CIRG_08840 [Coccidioides immitis RMSCC 2394]